MDETFKYVSNFIVFAQKSLHSYLKAQIKKF